MPHWYVVHAWSGGFAEMVSCLIQELTPRVEEDVQAGMNAEVSKTVIGPLGSPRKRSGTLDPILSQIYVWIGKRKKLTNDEHQKTRLGINVLNVSHIFCCVNVQSLEELL